MRDTTALLFDKDKPWDFDAIRRTMDALEVLARDDLGLDIYPNQIEIISAEQMLDAYSSSGMPLMYPHWSFGKHFLQEEKLYRKGYQGLAYEIVINADPCISFLMEQNSMPLQTIVLAHAAFGHNHFFKNNCLFREWTDAEGILAYLEFAKNYLNRCEEKYGAERVEQILDAAHALQNHGVFRSKPKHLRDWTLKGEEAEMERRREEAERTFNDLWRTVPRGEGKEKKSARAMGLSERRRRLGLPQENLLYFLEKHSPVLKDWEREILRIVRNISQYFYPQRQTKVMNEGFATFVHHHLMNALYEKGLLDEGSMLEMLHNHSNVVFQPDFDDPRYRGINPYHLGLAMLCDMRRVVTEPTDEDKEWFAGQEWVGCGDWRAVFRYAVAKFRDESFIRQFLSPRLIRELRLFMLKDDASESHYIVEEIHDEHGYRKVRSALAERYDVSSTEPDIQVIDVDLEGDRRLNLLHTALHGILLAGDACTETLKHLRVLWGYSVHLESVDGATGRHLGAITIKEKDSEELE